MFLFYLLIARVYASPWNLVNTTLDCYIVFSLTVSFHMYVILVWILSACILDVSGFVSGGIICAKFGCLHMVG